MDNYKILVLGSTGMLGSMVFSYLRQNNNFKVSGTHKITNNQKELFFDAEEFTKYSKGKNLINEYDYVINCIGIIKPYCKDDDPLGIEKAILINSLFPYALNKIASLSGTKIIQIATDCIYSGIKGKYIETDESDALDAYGKSKKLGEVIMSPTLNIRCSIIGPEKKGFISLLEWFLRNKEGTELNGFDHHIWNGVTTLQYAELCGKIIENNFFDQLMEISKLFHFCPNTTVTKYELLKLFNKVFKKDFKIKKIDNLGPKISRDLNTIYSELNQIYPTITMEKAIIELKNYMDMGNY